MADSNALAKPGKIVESIVQTAREETNSLDELVSLLEMVGIQLRMTIEEIKAARQEKGV